MKLVQNGEATAAAAIADQTARKQTLRDQRRRSTLEIASIVYASLLVATIASSASALPIHGGPLYAGGGGVTGTCSATGNACSNAGATVTCSGLNASSFQNLYYGIRNDQQVSGLKEAGNAGPVAGTDQFVSGVGSIRYSGTSTLHTV